MSRGVDDDLDIKLFELPEILDLISGLEPSANAAGPTPPQINFGSLQSRCFDAE
jgi:hypothetical protein